MEVLLREAAGVLALGSGGRNGPECRSVDEFKNKIARLFDGKVSDTRAEHVSASFDFPADVVLNLADATTDGWARGTLSKSDPEAVTVQKASARYRMVTVREVVMARPEAKALLQQAVAAFLIIHVRKADGSSWAKKPATHAKQGSTVTYVCQHSTEYWSEAHKRQHVVGVSTIDDMQDPILARPAFDCRGVVIITFSRSNRSVTVKYEHTNLHRSVLDLVKLFPPPRPPSPPPSSVVASASSNKRTKAAADGHGSKGGTPKKKRQKKSPVARVEDSIAAASLEMTDEITVYDGPGNIVVVAVESQPEVEISATGRPKASTKPTRPYKKHMKGAVSADSTVANGTMSETAEDLKSITVHVTDEVVDSDIVVSLAGELNGNKDADLLQHLSHPPDDSVGAAEITVNTSTEHSSTPKANGKATRASVTAKTGADEAEDNTQASSVSQEATARITTAVSVTLPGSKPPQPTASPTIEPTAKTETRKAPYMLVTESEVSTSRRLTAIKLLTERGVEPATLSHEQFCTLSNQTPALQKESLELLAHYGAERLAIVPAKNKSSTTTESPPSHPGKAR